MLSTLNLTLMNQVRHKIRSFDQVDGYAFETYNKRQFVKRFGISMYVTKENAAIPFKRLFRNLIYRYPGLKCPLELINRATFKDNPPNYDRTKCSRIGDVIYLIDSPMLADKLRDYPEDFRFSISSGATVSLRGGIRGHQLSAQFSANFTSSVMIGSAAEAMQNAHNNHRNGET